MKAVLQKFSWASLTFGTTTSVATALLLISRLPVSDTPKHFVPQLIAQSTREYSTMSSNLEQSKKNALYGLVIADALAMPVHWYYNPMDIKKGYKGWLTGFVAPNERHPSSILTLSAIDGSGRNGWHSKRKAVIGDMILHDKLKYWTSGNRSTHYHQGMQAGDSTLNAICAVKIAESLQKYDPDHTKPAEELYKQVFFDYIQFITTKGSHNDTYAESFHRVFFRDWVAMETPPDIKSPDDVYKFAVERSQKRLKGEPDSQVAVISALVISAPWIIHTADKPVEESIKITQGYVRLTHPAKGLDAHVEVYTRLLHAVLNGAELEGEIQKALESKAVGGKRKKEMILKLREEIQRYPKGSEEQLAAYQEATYALGSACYIDGAISTMLMLAYSFHDEFENGLLTNANVGGENCHRGGALGALLGAATVHQNKEIPDKWKNGLGTSRDPLAKITEAKL